MKNWYVKTIVSLLAVFIIGYALQWVLWQWLWLAIPVWIGFYLLHRKYGIMSRW
jgi:hypothetical protein